MNIHKSKRTSIKAATHWTEAYGKFQDAVEKFFPDEEEIEHAVYTLYRANQDDPGYQEAYRRWCETFTDEDREDAGLPPYRPYREANNQILYIIQDSHGNQLSAPNPDDSELWDRVASMEARGKRGLCVVAYVGSSSVVATRQNRSFTCPSCHNKTLYCIDHDVYRLADIDYHDKFVCDECGGCFESEVQHNGDIKFKKCSDSVDAGTVLRPSGNSFKPVNGYRNYRGFFITPERGKGFVIYDDTGKEYASSIYSLASAKEYIDDLLGDSKTSLASATKPNALRSNTCPEEEVISSSAQNDGNQMTIFVYSGISSNGFDVDIVDSSGQRLFLKQYRYGYNASYDRKHAQYAHEDVANAKKYGWRGSYTEKPYAADIIDDLCKKYNIDKSEIQFAKGKNIFKQDNVSDDTVSRFIQDYLYSSTDVYSDVNASEDFEDYEDEIQEIDQEFTSENTSINSGKLPAIFNMVHFEPGTINIDYGGGKFDNVADYLTQYDVINLVYDPYNRSKEHNKEVLRTCKAAGGADTATCSNVLNVIKEPEVRKNVLENIKKIVKPTGTVYITVYEGSGKGNEGPTKSGYQLNRKTADYLQEIQEVFPDAVRKGKLIVAHPSGSSVTSATITAKLIDTPQDVIDELIEVLNSNGFILDPAFKVNPGRTWMGDVHMQVIDPDSHVSTSEELRGYVTDALIDAIHAIEDKHDCPITWNFGANDAGHVTGGLDIMKKYTPDDEGSDIYSSSTILSDSPDGLQSRIYDYLDTLGGYADYNQKIEEVVDEFGVSPDVAETYVCNWIQNSRAEWSDEADIEDDEIYGAYRSTGSSREEDLPSRYCEPGSEDSDISGTTVTSRNLDRIRKELTDKLYNAASKLLQTPEYGFPFDEIANMLFVDINKDSIGLRVEVRAELSYDGMWSLKEKLDQIIQKYDKDSYFDIDDPGIMSAYLTIADDTVESADYGGAYDIDPHSYFTKDELVEFGDDVADTLTSKTGVNFQLSDVYIFDGQAKGSNKTRINFEFSDGDYTVEFQMYVDMRKIRKPSDINKYKDEAVQKALDSYQSVQSSTIVGGVYDYPERPIDPPEYDEPSYETDECTIELDLDTVITVDSDGSWEYEDEEYSFATNPDSRDGDWYSDEDEVHVIDPVGVVEQLDEFIEDRIPALPGRYRIKGKVTLVYDVEGIAVDYVYDAYEEDSSREIVDTDNVDVTWNESKSSIDHIDITEE